MAGPEEEEPRTYYEVELMLGQLDPSHIIRAIEYWDIERIRFPKRNHKAVIIAEEVTSRFFNVISLLNRAVPIIAIQLNAMKVEDKLLLKFTKVLDVTDLSEDEDDPIVDQEPVTLAFWEQKNPKMLAVANAYRELISEFRPQLTYNRSQVALSTTGRQFAWFNPRKSAPYCFTEFRLTLEDRDEWVAKLTSVGLVARSRGSKSMTLLVTDMEFKANVGLLQPFLQRCELLSR